MISARLLLWFGLAALLAGCSTSPAPSGTLAAARKGFTTSLTKKAVDGTPVPPPPAALLQVVSYQSPVGEMAAYVTPPAPDGKKHPAIIWISGGDFNGIDATFWTPAEADNDQSASAFREAGIVTMYPSLRGDNQNPGVKETFYGEVDDVLAALAWLQTRGDVDPKRIYLESVPRAKGALILADNFRRKRRGLGAKWRKRCSIIGCPTP